MRKLAFGAMFIALASIVAVGSASALHFYSDTEPVLASALYVDLTTAGASGTIGNAFFQQIHPDPTGTGYIDPFLRIRATSVEKGVNSPGPYMMNELAGIWTHSVLVSDFGVVDLNGTPSIRFMLDINESNNQQDKYLGLDMLKVYVADSPGYNTEALLSANATEIYDMGAGNAVHLNYGLNTGSGSGDMFAYLPYELFSGHTTQYLYLFSQFGGEGAPWDSNDGFEEWTNIDSAVPPPVPEPATLFFLGGGLLGAGLIRRRRRS